MILTITTSAIVAMLAVAFRYSLRCSRRCRLDTWGFAGAWVSSISLPLQPALLLLLVQAAPAAPPPIDIGAVQPEIPPSPADQFLSIHQNLYQRIFGYSDPALVHPLYRLTEPVSVGPGKYTGFNQQGVDFMFEAQRFVDTGWSGVEVAPGVILSEAAVVTGVLTGLEAVEVVALAGTTFSGGAAAGGAPDHFLLALSEIDTAGPDPGFDVPDAPGPGDGWKDAPDDGNCGCPGTGEPCPYFCLLCPDGVTVFCPRCDPILCQLSCQIAKAYDQCIDNLLDDLIADLIGMDIACALALLACLLMETGLGLAACLAGLFACAYELMEAIDNLLENLEACKQQRQSAYELLYDSYCAGAGGAGNGAP